MVVFYENVTLHLHSGSARIVPERPDMENLYALSLNEETGDVLVRENGSESLVFNIHSLTQNKSGGAAAEALSRAINRTTPRLPALEETLQVDDPYIILENPGDLPAGFPFTHHGSTNLGSTDEIVVNVMSSSFTPCPKSGCNRPSLSQAIRLSGWPGAPKNWTFEEQRSDKLPPHEYLVNVVATRTTLHNTTLLTIRPPFITIDPIDSHSVHDPFSVTGTTNIPAGETLFVELSDSSFSGPCHLNRQCNTSYHSKSVPVMAGVNTSHNSWKFSCDISTFDPSDEYLISAESFPATVYSNMFRISG